MNLELNNVELALVEEQIQYVLLVDASLAHVGGGNAVADY